MRSGYKRMPGISLKLINLIAMSIATIFSIFLLITIYLLADRYHDVNDATIEFANWEKQAESLERASDYLTENVRCYVIIYDKEYLDNYFNEKDNDKRRDNAIEELSKKLKGTDAFNALNSAMNKSNELMQTEFHAMRLIVEALYFDLNEFPSDIKNYQLSSEELALSREQKEELAKDLVFGDEYKEAKEYIYENVSNCLDKLEEMMMAEIKDSSNELRIIMVFQQVVIMLLIISLLAFFIFCYVYIVSPLNRGIDYIIDDELIKLEGIKEYRYFVQKYNDIRMKESVHTIELKYEAEHDRLTSLYNRTGYDLLCKKLAITNLTYILLDIDNFKLINDRFGHSVGDEVIKRVADSLLEFFGNGNYISRIGGDEFAILIREENDNLNDEIEKKVREINRVLIRPKNNIPGVTLSFGVAKGNEKDNISSLSVKADKALYETKRNGRASVTFYKDYK
jgi:diguanylate cyclase (GGDEF)-like protein